MTSDGSMAWRMQKQRKGEDGHDGVCYAGLTRGLEQR